MKALRKEFWMEIRKSKSRFISILLIVALGVAFFSGIQASSPDMRYSGDAYYDESSLMDIKVVGTMGLTAEDVSSIESIDGIESAEGAWSTDVMCGEGQKQKVLHIESLNDTVNKLDVQEGRLPEKSGEIFLDSTFASTNGYKVGDRVSLRESEDSSLLVTTGYTVVGIGRSPLYISFNRGNTTLGTGEVNGFGYVLPEDFDQEVYTQIYVTVHEAKELTSYTDGYENLIGRIKERVENIADAQCQIRLSDVKADAQKEIDDAKKKLDDGKKEADEKLAEARERVRYGDYDTIQRRYGSVPDVLSELIRTAFIPSAGKKLIVSDFSAVEARVIAWLAGEQWRMEVFERGGDIYCASASQMFGVPVEKHGVNGHLRQKGKIAELALGYGGSVGALKAMGALEMGLTEEELPTLVRQWRSANPHITRLWWDVDEAVMTAVRDKTPTYAHGIRFHVQSGMLFIHLPSGRDLCYAKPRIGENQFGSPAVTYMGVGATKKWERIESYGPKFVENIVQGISRDLLCYAMRTLRCCDIVAHVHDEIILEADPRVSLDAVCEQMGRTPPWAKGLVLRADGYECAFYKKD